MRAKRSTLAGYDLPPILSSWLKTPWGRSLIHLRYSRAKHSMNIGGMSPAARALTLLEANRAVLESYEPQRYHWDWPFD